MCAAANPGRWGLIGAPTYPMLKDTTMRSVFDALELEGIDYKYNGTRHELQFPDNNVFRGAKVLCRTMDKPERLRGTNLAWFGIDELTYCREEVWTRLEGRLRDPFAKQRVAFACWTPKGYDWVYERFVKPDREHPDTYEAVIASPGENRYLPEDFYSTLGKSYDKKFFEQEVLGQYLNVFSGQVYYAYSQQNVRQLDFDPWLPVRWSLDFNIEPMSSVIAQIKPMPGGADIIHVLDEMVIHQSNTSEACEAFRERMEKWARLIRGPLDVVVYGDATGNSRDSTSSNTDWQIIQMFFRRNEHLFRVEKKVKSSNPLVRDRVNSVNAMLRNADGNIRLYHDPRCKELAKDFHQVVYQTDSDGNTVPILKTSDKARTHISDALGYMVWAEFPIKSQSGFTQSPVPLI